MTGVTMGNRKPQLDLYDLGVYYSTSKDHPDAKHAAVCLVSWGTGGLAAFVRRAAPGDCRCGSPRCRGCYEKVAELWSVHTVAFPGDAVVVVGFELASPPKWARWVARRSAHSECQ